jgi:hypothetical protein
VSSTTSTHAIVTRARTEPHREEPYREATCETWSKVHTPTKVPEGMENLDYNGGLRVHNSLLSIVLHD